MATKKQFKRTEGDLFIEAIENLWYEYKRKSNTNKRLFLASLLSSARYTRKKGLREIILAACEAVEKDCYISPRKKTTDKANAESAEEKADKPTEPETHKYIKMVTDTLENYGIFQGDQLLIEKTDVLDENALTVFDVDGEKIFISAYGFENFGDISLMRNGALVMRKPAEQVKVIGKIVAVLKPFSNEPKEEEEETPEIRVSCHDCQRTEKGSEKFLKAQGWNLKRNLCVSCW